MTPRAAELRKLKSLEKVVREATQRIDEPALREHMRTHPGTTGPRWYIPMSLQIKLLDKLRELDAMRESEGT